jgi:homoserine O-succinyltransferase/O-acetyltransferase
MPVWISTSPSPELQSHRAEGSPIVIGLVNNMPDAALRSTERQFYELLSAASKDLRVCLRLFSIPELSRGELGRGLIAQSYEHISRLWTSRLDGLIVTGTEPRAAVLTNEPYWTTLTKIVDWAEDHTFSTIWSCLAAHAAVLHLDCIPRRALREKLSGTFDCGKAEEHTIMFGVPSRWRVPHSRCNELPEEALVFNGYRILSRSVEAGADIFVKERTSLFIFMQGHPEYDPGALLREYRRDAVRFLDGERASYPEIPRGYFDNETAALLTAYRQQVVRKPGRDLIPSFPAVDKQKLPYDWREVAIQFYTNWFSRLAEEKARTLALSRLAITEAAPEPLGHNLHSYQPALGC